MRGHITSIDKKKVKPKYDFYYLENLADAEITDLHGAGSSNEKIVRFYITMHNILWFRKELGIWEDSDIN